MAVILTGMNMPDSCHSCKYQQCYFYGKKWQTIDGEKDYRTSVNKTCPLKSVDGLIDHLRITGTSYIYEQDVFRVIREYCGEG